MNTEILFILILEPKVSNTILHCNTYCHLGFQKSFMLVVFMKNTYCRRHSRLQRRTIANIRLPKILRSKSKLERWANARNVKLCRSPFLHCWIGLCILKFVTAMGSYTTFSFREAFWPSDFWIPPIQNSSHLQFFHI